MNKDPGVVVDTNILLSGLFGKKNSPSARVLQFIRNQKVILVASSVMLEEVADVISRERIVKLTKMNGQERLSFMKELIQRSEVTKGKKLSEIVSRDSEDDKILACAVEGKVDYIITGDEDLLVLKKYQGIEIVTPREFVELLG